MNESSYGPDLLTLVDDEGNEHEFEVIDSLETDDGERYLALLPGGESENVDEDGELVILKVFEGEDGEEFLEAIEDEEEFNTISAQFIERLDEYFDIQE